MIDQSSSPPRGRRRHRARGLLGGVAAGALALSLGGTAHAAAGDVAATNPAPGVAPSLQQWTGETGTFRLTPDSSIVLRPGHDDLFADATTFRADLRAITGRLLPMRVGGSGREGDIVLDEGATGLPANGYTMNVGQALVIDGANATGTFYGEQTVEQILKRDPHHAEVPRGQARDWSDTGTRGIMLDLGRHYYQPSFVSAEIREAAWLKLDDVHLHLTEADAFRLEIPQYPGLASAQHYTDAQITSWVREARRYHVTLVPEVDVPAHSTAITTYDPALKWDCDSMNHDPWGGQPGFTLDVTKPATTQLVTAVITRLAQLFPYSPVIHLGGDEYPYLATQQQCPELVDYAAAHGYASTEDVIVAWQNQLAGVVTSLGRRPEIWNWWDRVGSADVLPTKSFIINAWTGTPDTYLSAGYDTVSSPGGVWYVTPETPPGGAITTNDASLYASWQPEQNSHLLGYELSVWSDDAETQPDGYFLWFFQRGEQVLADRLWGGPRLASVFAYQDLLDDIGTAPGVPEPAVPGVDATQLTGTPYGSGSVASAADHGYDAAFDGDVGTYVDLPQASGGYAGIDLGADHAARVVKIRFVPRDNTAQNLSRMVGGTFQGCTDGPDSGCHTLATVTWRPPTYEWSQLPVTDSSSYRWLRYVSPTNGYTNVAEIQFYGAR